MFVSGDFVIPVHNESQSSFGDHFWSTEVTKETNVINEMNHHNLLKLTVSELCNNLKFSVCSSYFVQVYPYLEYKRGWVIGQNGFSLLHFF